jgi:hypothetical protein
MKSALKLLLGVAVFALAALSPASRPADAQTPSPYCQYGTATYNAVLCAQYGGSTSVYCQAGTTYYNAALCAQNSGSSSSLYCQAGTTYYNAALCAQYSGSSSSLYCQAGSTYYNAALCTQYGGASSPYCQAGTLTYNAALCTQYGGSNTLYCQVGTVNYNAALCAQSSNLYCQVGTANYNASLCSQFNVSQASSVVVRSTASGVDCGSRASISLEVRTAVGAQVPDGTSVLLSVNLGTISPTQVTTNLGRAQATYSAPPNGTGTITVTATAGTVSGTTIMALDCEPVAPTRVPTVAPAVVAAVPPAASAPQLPVTSPAITPPNTGDAGLASSD